MKQNPTFTPKSEALWLQLKATFKQLRADEFEDVRNCAFHFGDFNEEPIKLLEIYGTAQKDDTEAANKMLKALYDVGFQLSDNAWAAYEAAG